MIDDRFWILDFDMFVYSVDLILQVTKIETKSLNYMTMAISVVDVS